ncbi:MAG: hypothetical protein PHN82_01965 [bacterium]|nr:hypothetical protein [bacterium]
MTVRPARLAALAVALAALARPAFPWGSFGHRLVNRAAVDTLPAEMADDGSGFAFGDMKDELEYRSLEPDRRKRTDWREHARHWCDIDAKVERHPPPFDTVPRDYDAYVREFGRPNGVIQWEGILDTWERLGLLMAAGHWPLAYRAAAELGHYVGDAACPLHCTANHDGERSADPRNAGIHSRYESGMVNRYITRIDAVPGSALPVDDPIELGFSLVATGQALVAGIMEADLSAQDAGGGAFDRDYYRELYALLGREARGRLELASRALAGLWLAAWEAAGRPAFGAGAMLLEIPPPRPFGGAPAAR